MEIQATFRRLQPTEELERHIFENARALDELTGHELTFCHVVVEGSSRAQESTRVHLAVLGTRGALGVTHDIHVRARHEHPMAALAEAFDAVQRRILAELARREARERASDDARSRMPARRKAALSWAS